MVNKYSVNSKRELETCDYDLVQLFSGILPEYDHTIIEGHRPRARQLELYEKGLSKVREGRHNSDPSNAVDASPYIQGRGIPWPKMPENMSLSANQRAGINQYVKDMMQFAHFAGYVEASAAFMSVPIRWGGDWDRDHNLSDQTFDDLVHFELER